MRQDDFSLMIDPDTVIFSGVSFALVLTPPASTGKLLFALSQLSNAVDAGYSRGHDACQCRSLYWQSSITSSFLNCYWCGTRRGLENPSSTCRQSLSCLNHTVPVILLARVLSWSDLTPSTGAVCRPRGALTITLPNQAVHLDKKHPRHPDEVGMHTSSLLGTKQNQHPASNPRISITIGGWHHDLYHRPGR